MKRLAIALLVLGCASAAPPAPAQPSKEAAAAQQAAPAPAAPPQAQQPRRQPLCSVQANQDPPGYEVTSRLVCADFKQILLHRISAEAFMCWRMMDCGADIPLPVVE